MQDRIRVEGLPAAPLGHYWAAGAAMGTGSRVVCAASAIPDDVKSDLVDELRKVLDLAMNDESDLREMLRVAVSLLTKSLTSRDTYGESAKELAKAALAVMVTVESWMTANATPGLQAYKAAIGREFKTKATRMIANAKRPGGAGSAAPYSATIIRPHAETRRQSIIGRAKSEYQANSGRFGPIDLRSHIDGELIAACESPLTDGEAQAVVCGATRGGPTSESLVGQAGRENVIEKANIEFNSMGEKVRRQFNRVVYVNQALRDAELSPLTKDERVYLPADA